MTEASISTHTWNATETVPLALDCVHELFRQQVARTPESPAVLDGPRSTSFRELDTASNQLAQHLVERGVRPGAIVGIYLPRSSEMITAMLAVFKAGGGCLSLDPRLPAERLLTILLDAHPACVVTNNGMLTGSLPSDVRIMNLDGQREEISRCTSGAIERVVPLSSLAYVIYTSGSTGKPKGVAMPHRTLANLVDWELARQSVAKPKTLQYAAIGFGVSFQEIFSTLCSGGTLVIVPETFRGDAAALLRFVHEQKIKRLFIPYSVLRLLADAAQVTAIVPDSLSEIICAGEPLHVGRSIREFFRLLPGCSLENQYGASETLIVTSLRLEGAADSWNENPPIGKPIPNAQIYILDEDGKPVAVGAVGEIHIGGAVLADGYLNLPEVTASKFMANPFTAAPGARLYKTGDLGRVLHDGTIQYMGRKDDQVKIRGNRVEPAEIVAVLKRHPALQDAVVLALGDDVEGYRLLAYVVPEKGVEVRREELVTFLRGTLPDYMVPSGFIDLAELPLLPSGKVDRNALRKISMVTGEHDEPFVPPQTETESRVAQVFSEILSVHPVSANDGFFVLGGESLKAMWAMLRLSKEFGAELPVRLIFENPSVRDLSSVIQRILHDRPHS